MLVNGGMLIEGKTFEEVASISGLIRLVKTKASGMGEQFLSCMIKEMRVAQVGIFFKHLAIGISNLAYIFNPETIIIGGGITDRGNEF